MYVQSPFVIFLLHFNAPSRLNLTPFPPLLYDILQVPYIILASLSFTLPFFYIVGFQHVGDPTVNFFWYWLFQGLLTFVMVYFGQFFAALCPTPQSAQGIYAAVALTSMFLVYYFCSVSSLFLMTVFPLSLFMSLSLTLTLSN